MKLKRIVAFTLLTSLVLCAACSKKTASENSKKEVESIENNNRTNEENVETTVEETPISENETTVEESTISESETTEEESTLTEEQIENQESMDAYEKFMRNETKISFDYYMPNTYMEEEIFQTGSEYTLSEVLAAITTQYFEYSTDKKLKYIDYSYIDCGKDKVNELVLRFNSMDLYGEEDDSTLVYIIKHIDGKLALCYSYETWARSQSTLNEYGYYQSYGSAGASYHMIEYGFIDKDGNYQSIASIESEMDINQFAYLEGLEQIPTVAKSKGIYSGFELQNIHLNKSERDSDVAGTRDDLYTFYVYDENMELIKDANLYTNSIYKDILDEAMVPFVTPDQIDTMILKKEEKVGVTAEIKEGKEIIWKTLSGNLFPEYVGQ